MLQMGATKYKQLGGRSGNACEGRLTWTFACVCFLALLLGFAGSLAIYLPNLRLHVAGTPGSEIGFSTAFQALGIVAGAMGVIPVLSRIGTARIISGGCLLASMSIMCLGLAECSSEIALWRFVLGLGIGAAVSQLEFVVLARARPDNKTRDVSIYATFFGLGAVAASGLGVLAQGHEFGIFLAAAAGLLLNALISGLAGIREQVRAPGAGVESLQILRTIPSAFLPALVYGILEGGLISLINVYAMASGYSFADASIIATAAVAGSIIWRVPVGLFADRVGLDRVLHVSWAVIIVLLLALHVTVGMTGVALVIAFCLGGVCDVFYCAGIARLSLKIDPGELASANSIYVAICGCGEITGPVLGGFALAQLGASGFIAMFLLVSAIGLLGTIERRQIFTVSAMPRSC